MVGTEPPAIERLSGLTLSCRSNECVVTGETKNRNKKKMATSQTHIADNKLHTK